MTIDTLRADHCSAYGYHRETTPRLDALAEHGILLIVHTGAEHSSPAVSHQFSGPAKLETALQEGCTVIAAHAGMGAFFDAEDFFPELVDLRIGGINRLFRESRKYRKATA